MELISFYLIDCIFMLKILNLIFFLYAYGFRIHYVKTFNSSLLEILYPYLTFIFLDSFLAIANLSWLIDPSLSCLDFFMKLKLQTWLTVWPIRKE